MKQRDWAMKIVAEGYRALLVQYHPDRAAPQEREKSTEICQSLAVARDELNALIESTKYQPQQPGVPMPAPAPVEETVYRILNIAEALIFGPKKPRRAPRRPRR